MRVSLALIFKSFFNTTRWERVNADESIGIPRTFILADRMNSFKHLAARSRINLIFFGMIWLEGGRFAFGNEIRTSPRCDANIRKIPQRVETGYEKIFWICLLLKWLRDQDDGLKNVLILSKITSESDW